MARRVGVAALLPTLVAAVVLVVAPPARATGSSWLAPSGALLGSFAGPRGSETDRGAITDLEASIGRKLDVDRVYQSWDDPEPGRLVSWDVANSRIPFVSIDATKTDGTAVAWSSISSGAEDAQIDVQAAGLKSLGVPILMNFHHEPEHSPQNGTPAEFIAAWGHYVSRVRADGLNATFVFILEGSTYLRGNQMSWYPGDATVDWIGSDGYNSFGCRGETPAWVDFSTEFTPFDAFGVSRGKPLAIGEFGSVEDPARPGRKAAWFSGAASTLASWPEVRVASYFDSISSNCNWYADTSASSLQAFAQLGAQPTFHSRPLVSFATQAASGPAPLAVTVAPSVTAAANDPTSSWSLDFGDGSASANGSGTPPASVSHSYRAGTWTARFTVTDQTGQSDFAPLSVVAFPPPEVSTFWTSASSPTSIPLAGSVNPEGLDTSWHFEWGLTTAYANSSPPVDAGSAAFVVRVSFTASGLTPGATYHYRLVGVNAAGTSDSADEKVKTPGPPGVTTQAASAITTSGATLAASISPQGIDTHWQFQWGPTTSLGGTVPSPSADAGSTGPVTVTEPLSGLLPNTTYYYRVIATNAAGTTDGQTRSFTTSGPPAISAEWYGSATATSVILYGMLRPDGSDTTWQFDYGVTTSYGARVPLIPADAGGGVAQVSVSEALKGLLRSTTYHYRLVAVNSAGTVYGQDETFKTTK